ncbi:hypothetical protein MMC18_004134 [Xylographa bjoerkii]|nr:hypothetical protein [Xylographa bjoerkii]
MSDTSSSTEEALPSANDSVPVIDIDWIEKILDGTYDLPKFQMGDEVCVVNNDSTIQKLYHDLQLSRLHSSRPVNPEAEVDERDAESIDDSEADGEGPASSLGDDQWEDVVHPLPHVEGESPVQLNRPVADEPSITPSGSRNAKEDRQPHIPEDNDVAATDNQGILKENSHVTRTPMVATGSDILDARLATEHTVTLSEVSGSQHNDNCKDSLHKDTEYPTCGEEDVIERSEDNDWVCICVSDKVARVAKEARKDTLVKLTSSLGFLAKGETDFPYQKETNPWMVQLFDERLRKSFQRILDGLECLEEVKRQPKRGHGHPHINSRMSDIIKEHIEDIGDILVGEIEAMLLVKDFLTDMINQEPGTTAWPWHGTEQESMAAVNRNSRKAGGLSQRVLLFLNHLIRFFPQDTMSMYARDVSPTLRVEGRYDQKFTDLPFERWGGLETLLDIHENDAVMHALATCIYAFAFNSVYLNIDRGLEAEFDEVHLTETESAIVKGIWLGEEPARGRNLFFLMPPSTYGGDDRSPESSGHEHAEDTLRCITKLITIKCIYHQRRPGDTRTVEVDNEDFYRLYRKYKGRVHPQEKDEPVSPASQDPSQKIKFVYVGVESLDVGLIDYKLMVDFYRCEDLDGIFMQRLRPPTRNDASWPYLVVENGQASWVAQIHATKGSDHRSWSAAD